VYPHLSLLGNGSVDTFPWEPIHATIEEFLDDSFSIRFVSYQRESIRLCIPLSLLGNGSVNTFNGDEELLEASFSKRSVSYQRKVGY
jgi:hypothetical protein